MTSPATATGVLAAAEFHRGDVIAQRYRIENLLGVGGMGVVYRAHDLQLDVSLALKLLRPEFAARPDAFERFKQELLLARQVSSPHVVRIHDLVEHNGLWLISMDFVPGASLEQRLDRTGPLTVDEAVNVLRQIALGLAAAHDRGVVHRDLKPANILVTDDLQAVISDFGVARSLGQTGMTGTGMVVGTPEYLSPEQARGETVDGRSDLYSLGLIFYEMLVGRLPFSGSTTAESLAQRIVRSPPPPRLAKPGIAAWIDTLCSRLVALRPSHRLPNARAVVEAIDRRKVPGLPGRWQRRGAIALLAVALGAGGTWLWQHRPLAEQAVVVEPLDLLLLPVRVPANADAEARNYADGLSSWLWSVAAADAMRTADPERMQVLLDQFGYDADAAARNSAQLTATQAAHRVLAPELVKVGREWHLRWQEPGAAAVDVPLPEQGVAGWSGAASLLPPRQPEAGSPGWPRWPGRAALVVLGEARGLERGDPVPAAAAYARQIRLAPGDGSSWRFALALADRTAQPNAVASLAESANVALATPAGHDARVARAHAALLLGDYEAAAPALAKAVEQAPSDLPARRLLARLKSETEGPQAALPILQVVVTEDPQNLRGWLLLGRNALLAGDVRRAVDDYLVRALVIALRIGDERAAAEARNALGIGYDRLGQTSAAVENYSAAASARERLGDPIGAASSLRNLAAAEAVQGRPEVAEAALDRAGKLLEGIDAPAAIADLNNDRGVLAEERGDFVTALSSYRDALALRQSLDDAASTAESQLNVGFVYYQTGEFDNALVYWRQAEQAYGRISDEAGRLRAEQSLTLIDLAHGAWPKARATLERSIKTAEKHQMAEDLAVSLNYLGEVSRVQGRLGEALRQQERSRERFAQRQDQRGVVQAELDRAAVLLAAGAWVAADETLAKLDPAEGGNHEQVALQALRLAQAAFGRGDPVQAAALLAKAQAGAVAAHSQPVAIEADLFDARLAAARGDRAASRLALAKARTALEHFAPVPLSLLAVETELQLGDTSRYEQAQGLLRRAPGYGRAHAIHHAAAIAFAAAGNRGAADAARASWQEALQALRKVSGLPEELRAGFDAMPESGDPG